jgi:hypothetical protein
MPSWCAPLVYPLSMLPLGEPLVCPIFGRPLGRHYCGTALGDRVWHPSGNLIGNPPLGDRTLGTALGGIWVTPVGGSPLWGPMVGTHWVNNPGGNLFGGTASVSLRWGTHLGGPPLWDNPCRMLLVEPPLRDPIWWNHLREPPCWTLLLRPPWGWPLGNHSPGPLGGFALWDRSWQTILGCNPWFAPLVCPHGMRSWYSPGMLPLYALFVWPFCMPPRYSLLVWAHGIPTSSPLDMSPLGAPVGRHPWRTTRRTPLWPTCGTLLGTPSWTPLGGPPLGDPSLGTPPGLPLWGKTLECSNGGPAWVTPFCGLPLGVGTFRTPAWIYLLVYSFWGTQFGGCDKGTQWVDNPWEPPLGGLL